MGSESKRRTRLVVLEDDGMVSRAVGVDKRNIHWTVGEMMMMMKMMMMVLTAAEVGSPASLERKKGPWCLKSLN